MICVFSIIIPVYNGAHVIKTSVESVLKQTYQDWELIIVDDGSSDALDAALSPYISDPRIQVIHKKNGGVSVARNTGMAQAKHRYICFLDADDEWLDNHLELYSRMVAKYPDAGLYCTAYRIVFPGNREVENTRYFTGEGEFFLVEDFYKYTEDLKGKVFTNPVAVCVSAEAVKFVGGFQPSVKIGEDTDFMFRITAYFPVVFSGVISAVYHHELSVATKDTGLDFDWYFQKREATLLADERISVEKRRYIKIFMDRFRIHKCRHLMMHGQKKEALAVLRSVGHQPALRKELLVSMGLLLIPYSLLQSIYKVKKSNDQG